MFIIFVAKTRSMLITNNACPICYFLIVRIVAYIRPIHMGRTTMIRVSAGYLIAA